MADVRDQAGPLALHLAERQSDRLRVELGVVEERELPEPLVAALAAGVEPREPERDRDPNQALAAARVEGHRVEGPGRARRPRCGGRVAVAPVEESRLSCEASTQALELDVRSQLRDRFARTMPVHERRHAEGG